ncbi:MAG: KilA-N domain-containing protein [Chthoniobacteraceae bacterium]
MSKTKRSIIEVKGASVAVLSEHQQDFICLTDIARYKDAVRTDYLISNWLRNRNTIEFLGIWEQLNNSGFNPIEFDGIRKQAGLNSFILTAKRWVDATGAIGLISKSGRYGGTYAHKDIAFEFASWVSVEFKLYLIKEFQRLKDEENDRLQLGWNLQRTLAKINYRIHTDAIKETLIPAAVTKSQAAFIYADEADLLNVALFGQTAKQWRETHPNAEGNIRDHAPLEQLVVLTNLESLNSVLIRQGLLKLNEIAITQMRTLLSANTVKRLK